MVGWNVLMGVYAEKGMYGELAKRTLDRMMACQGGQFNEALSELKRHNGLKDSIIAWTTVMGAARNRHNLDVGELPLENLATNTSARVMMCHIYTAHGHHHKANNFVYGKRQGHQEDCQC